MDRKSALSLGLPAAFVALVGCQSDLVEHGEAVVVVNTDVDVTQYASRVRFDVYDERGGWLASQDVAATGQTDWPLSFSIVHPDDRTEATVTMRARAYAQGALRDYRGNRSPASAAWTPPVLASGLPALCAIAPELTIGKAVMLRRGTSVLTTFPASCGAPNQASSVAGKISIAKAGDYAFSVVHSTPDARLYPGAAVSLALRADCTNAAEAIACTGSVNKPTFMASLEPGTYFVLTGGTSSMPSDIDLLITDGAGPPVPTPLSPPTPRLVADGIDITPATEPEPAVTMDRLVKIHLRPGLRGRLELDIHGECLGTEADVPNLTSCVDRAGTRVQAPTLEPIAPVSRTADALPVWAATAGDCAGVAGVGREYGYPWGEEPPGCDEAMWGRAGLGPLIGADGDCLFPGTFGGPAPPGSGRRDVIVPDRALPEAKVFDLSGNMAEWAADAWSLPTDAFWSPYKVYRDPLVTGANAPQDPHPGRGGSWALGARNLRAGERGRNLASDTLRSVGFRCARVD